MNEERSAKRIGQAGKGEMPESKPSIFAAPEPGEGLAGGAAAGAGGGAQSCIEPVNQPLINASLPNMPNIYLYIEKFLSAHKKEINDSGLSTIFDVVLNYNSIINEEEKDDKSNIYIKWCVLLFAIINCNGGLLTRAGDLIHDILKQGMIARVTGGITMQEFILSLVDISNPGTRGYIDAKINQYLSSISAVKTDFLNIRRIFFEPQKFKLTSKDLNELTKILKDKGVEYVFLDSQFGNIFADGFGEGFKYISSVPSYIDGATKLSSSKVRENNLIYCEDTTPFKFPYLYPNVEHAIEREGKKNIVTITTNEGVIRIECEGGISVNAVCNKAGIPPPRGSGKAENPIEVFPSVIGGAGGAGAGAGGAGAGGSHLYNHVVMVKTMTDWAQLVYVKLLTMAGVSIVFITNDEFCLGLAALLGLPYVIRTPSTNVNYIEYYEFDPNYEIISNKDINIIKARLLSFNTAEEQKKYKTLETIFTSVCTNILNIMRSKTPKPPDSFINKFINDIRIINDTISEYLITINEIISKITTRAIKNDELKRYRGLLRSSVYDNILIKVKQLINILINKYISFGNDLKDLLTVKIKEADIIPDLLATMINFFGDDILQIKEVIESILVKDGDIGIYSKKGELWRITFSKLINDHIKTLIEKKILTLKKGYTPINILGGSEWDRHAAAINRYLWDLKLFNAKEDPIAEYAAGAIAVGAVADAGGGAAAGAGGGAGALAAIVAHADEKRNNKRIRESQGGGAIQRGGGDSIENLIVDELTTYLSEKYTSYIYKPSCSAIVESLLDSLNDLLEQNEEPTPSENSIAGSINPVKLSLVDKIIEILQAFTIDAFESNFGEEYRYELFVLDDIRDEVKAGIFSLEEFAQYIFLKIFYDDIFMFVTDVVSPKHLRSLMLSINAIGNLFDIQIAAPAQVAPPAVTTSSTSSSSSETVPEIHMSIVDTARTGSTNLTNPTKLGRITRAMMARLATTSQPPAIPTTPGLVATGSVLPTTPGLVTGYSQEAAVPNAGFGVSIPTRGHTQRGGARKTRRRRRRHNRTRKANAAAAARRRRTIRRRK